MSRAASWTRSFELAGQRRTAESIELAAGAATVAAVGSMALLRIAINGSLAMPAPVESLYGIVGPMALLIPAGAAVALGLASPDARVRTGLLAVGVFAGLAAAVPAARLPAIGVVIAGGGVALAARLTQRRGWRTDPRTIVVAVWLLAGAVTLGSASALLGGPARALGSGLALLGLASSPAFVRPRRAAWLAGAVAFLGVVAAGLAAPFVTGAVTLVVGAVVGVPLVLVGLGVAGGTTALVGAVASGRWIKAFGVASLLAAGVPATVPRAVAVMVGLALLVGVVPDG